MLKNVRLSYAGQTTQQLEELGAVFLERLSSDKSLVTHAVDLSSEDSWDFQREASAAEELFGLGCECQESPRV